MSSPHARLKRAYIILIALTCVLAVANTIYLLCQPDTTLKTLLFCDMKYTRFEKARIIGARALQISYGAPVLVDYPESMLDPIDIAMLEYDNDLIPISVVRN